MGFEKVRMGKGFISNVSIKDENGAKIDDWTTMLSDLPKVYRIIKSKYGLEELVKDKDLNWALK